MNSFEPLKEASAIREEIPEMTVTGILEEIVAQQKPFEDPLHVGTIKAAGHLSLGTSRFYLG